MADADVKIEIRPGKPFECPCNYPGCREKLVKIDDDGPKSWFKKNIKFALIPLAVVAIGAIATMQLIPRGGGGEHPTPSPPTVDRLLKDVWPWLERKP
jgi:hypothetical protein